MECATSSTCTSPYSVMLKNRNAALRLRNGSPKFKEVLRQRYRERIRSKRTSLFDASRDLPVSQNELASFLQEELQNIYANFSEDDSGFNSQGSSEEFEPLSSDEQRLMDECDRFIAYEDDFIRSMLEEKLVCPLCMKGALVSEFIQVASCQQCKAKISAPEGLQNLEYKINSAVNNHQQSCTALPSFFQNCDETNNLYIICCVCSHFEMIV